MRHLTLTLPKAKKMKKALCVSILLCLLAGTSCGKTSEKPDNRNTITITNVSYDPTRELYEAYNQAFTEHYKKKTGKDANIVMSHGG